VRPGKRRNRFSKHELQIYASRGNHEVTRALLTLHEAGYVVAVAGRKRAYPGWALTERGLNETNGTNETDVEPALRRAHG
jgi:hypothetical protein